MKAKKHHCFHCQHSFFLTEELPDEYVEKGCMAVEGQQIVPNESDIMIFKHRYLKKK